MLLSKSQREYPSIEKSINPAKSTLLILYVCKDNPVFNYAQLENLPKEN